MDEVTPTKPAKHTRTLRLLGLMIAALLVVLGIWLFVNPRPRWYSPADVVRSQGDYTKKMNPSRLSGLSTNVPPATNAFTVTLKTNQGKLRIEYPLNQSKREDSVGYILHRLKGDEVLHVGDSTIQLKRIGHVWAPPGTNQYYYSSANLPAAFYRPDLRLMSEAEVVQELPNKWDRTMNCQKNLPGYRFDLEIQNSPWKYIGGDFYDARTHYPVTHGWSSREMGKSICRIDIAPFLWRSTPVEMVVDIALGPPEEEEISPQVGTSFTVGAARYYLIFAGDDLSLRSYGSGSDLKTAYVQLDLRSGVASKKKECVLIFHAEPEVTAHIVDMEYLDADGRKISLAGSGSSSANIFQSLPGKLSDIKKIIVRKHRNVHRLVFSLPYLPGLPPENDGAGNLFTVRVPVLRFDQAYEQERFLEDTAQLKLTYISKPPFPPNTYPRWFTNATVADVMEDYANLMQMQDQLYVDQQKLSIEKGRLPLPLLMKKKTLEFWKKIKGP